MSKLILSRDGIFHDNLRANVFHSSELREKVVKSMFDRQTLLSLCLYHSGMLGLNSMTDGQLVDILEDVAEEYRCNYKN